MTSLVKINSYGGWPIKVIEIFDNRDKISETIVPTFTKSQFYIHEDYDLHISELKTEKESQKNKIKVKNATSS